MQEWSCSLLWFGRGEKGSSLLSVSSFCGAACLAKTVTELGRRDAMLYAASSKHLLAAAAPTCCLPRAVTWTAVVMPMRRSGSCTNYRPITAACAHGRAVCLRRLAA